MSAVGSESVRTSESAVPESVRAPGSVGPESERAPRSVVSESVVSGGSLCAAVKAAVAQVCDPEYPDLTIAELGILERVWVRDGQKQTLVVELVPTMLGCPALDVIERDVRTTAQAALDRIGADAENLAVEVRFLSDPVWTPSRIKESSRRFLEREYTVAVHISGQTPACPNCGTTGLEHRSDFGPTPCRTVHWCRSCRNPVEVIGRG